MDQAPDLPPPLGKHREAALARTVELGVIAEHALTHPWPVDATLAELGRIAAEGRQAREQFLSANLRLAALLAGQAARRTGMDYEDLFQEACLAVSHALQRFDHTRGRFTTYALPAVAQHLAAVTSSLAGVLGLPAGRALALRRAQGVADRLSQQLGRAARVGEVSAALGRDEEWTARLLSHQPPVPLQFVAETVGAVPQAFDDRDDQLVFQRLLPELDRLPGEQREVLRLRYGLADGRRHTYREIAVRAGTSPSSVRRVEQRGLATLRRWHQQATQPEAAAG